MVNKPMEVVIDTNVWITATGKDLRVYSKKNLESLHLLLDLLDNINIQIALDVEGLIIEEYHPYIFGNPLCLGLFNSITKKKNKFTYYSNCLDYKVIRHLDKLHFDLSDRKFIGVAQKTTLPHVIINETDSDWTPEVCCYLRNKHNIDVTNCIECKERYLELGQSAAETDDPV